MPWKRRSKVSIGPAEGMRVWLWVDMGPGSVKMPEIVLSESGPWEVVVSMVMQSKSSSRRPRGRGRVF